MKPRNQDIVSPATAGSRLLPLLCLAVLLTATSAAADPYFVYGQIYQITEGDAADSTIADSSLIGSPHPYGLVKVFNASTGASLGQAFASEDGVFTVQYEMPAGSTPDLELKVYLAMTDPDPDQELPAAREGINTFSGVGQFHGSPLRVIPPEFLRYDDLTPGGEGLPAWSGTGIVFTRVGKVEVPFIPQTPVPNQGMADFSTDVVDPVTGKKRHQELYVSDFRDAPFSGGLLIFGALGEPDGMPADCPLPYPNERVDYYQVFIKDLSDSTSHQWMQPMTKLRTDVVTAGIVSVTSARHKIGPFTDDKGTPDTTDDVVGLYWVNRNASSPGLQTIYSFPDQRINWNTRSWQGAAASGKYEITMKYFRHTGGSIDDPTVDEFPAGCFTQPPPPPASSLGLEKLILEVDNRPLNAGINHIWLKHSGTGRYYKKLSADVVDPVADGASDFAAGSLCDIMELENQYDIEVDFTAQHPEFMRSYSMSATPNVGSPVSWGSKSYVQGTDPIGWSGVVNETSTVPTASFVQCGYDFDLHARSRLQNGYHYVQWYHKDWAFYVKPLP